jgi:hypothetical protein
MSPDQKTTQDPLIRDRWMGIVEQLSVPLADLPLRRRSPRYRVDKTVKVIIHPSIGAPKIPQELTCSVVEVSADGMMLRTRQEMRAYTKLTIEWADGEETLALPGKVRHSTGTVGAFKIGVELDFT